MRMMGARTASAGKHLKAYPQGKSSRGFLAFCIGILSIVLLISLSVNFALAGSNYWIELSADDDEMDYSVKIDYSDDKLIKHVEISDLMAVDSARIKIYGKSDNCPGVERHYIEVNGDPTMRIYFNPCLSFDSSFAWQIIDVPLEFLRIGENTFLLSDGSDWTASNLWIGVDEDTELTKSDICWGADCNERGDGELMVRLELMQSKDEQEQEMDLDGDGIPNIMDNCPFEPEVFNNYYDDDGCPDEVPAPPGPDIFEDTDFSIPESSRDNWYNCDKCYTRASTDISPAIDECILIYDEFDDDDTGHTPIGAAETDRYDRVIKLRVYAPGTGEGDTIAGNANGEMWIDWIAPRSGESKVLLRGHLEGDLMCEYPVGDEPACWGLEAFATVNIAAVVEDDDENEITSMTLFKGCCSHRTFAGCYQSELDVDEDFEAMLSFDAKQDESYKIKVTGFVYASACDGDAEADFKNDGGKIVFDSVEIRIPNKRPVAKGAALNPLINQSSDGITPVIVHDKNVDSLRPPTGATCQEVGGYCESMKNRCGEAYYECQYEGCYPSWKCCCPKAIEELVNQTLEDVLELLGEERELVLYPSSDVFPYVHFSGGESYDPDEGDSITYYEWDFGDGETRGTQKPEDVYHYYLNNVLTEYEVTLTVTDTCGAIDTDKFKIKVLPIKSPTGCSCQEVGGYCIPMENECGDNFVETWRYECPLEWKCCHPQINLSAGGQYLDDLFEKTAVYAEIDPSKRLITLESPEGTKELQAISLSINQRLVTLSINASKSEISIESNNVSAITNVLLKIENQSLFIQTGTGYKEITMMPDEAATMAEGKTEKIELHVIEDEPIYTVKSQRRAKVLWLFQTDMEVETRINAGTGIVEEEITPWWDIFVTSW